MDKDNDVIQPEEESGVIIELHSNNNDSSRVIRHKDNGAKLSGFAYAVIVVLILIVTYVIADISTGGFIYTANGRFQSFFDGGSSQSFNFDLNANNVCSFERYSDGFMILTENGVSFVDKNGSLMSGQQLVYSEPACEHNDKNIVFFDRGNQSYTIMKNQNVRSQKKLENKIIDFAVSEKDNYALVVRDDTKSVLLGCDARDEVIYRWDCPHGYITDVSIDDNGSKVVASVLNSVNANLNSKIYILDFEYDSAYAEFDYSGETVLCTKFLSGKKIIVITDKKIYKINGKEQEVIHDFGSQDICYADYSDKYTAVITKDYSNDESYFLIAINNNGKIKYTVELSGKVKGLSVSDKSIAVLFDDKTETYSVSGKLVGQVTKLKHYEDVVINKNYVYVLGADSVKRFSAYGMNSYEPPITESITE